MTAHKQFELTQIFKDWNTVTVTVAPNNRKSDDEAYDIIFHSLDEAVDGILKLENDNTVFF